MYTNISLHILIFVYFYDVHIYLLILTQYVKMTSYHHTDIIQTKIFWARFHLLGWNKSS